MPFTMPPDFEIVDEASAYRYAERLQALIQLATNLDTSATALRQRIIIQLRAEGLDGSTGLRGALGASDAVRTADKAIKPLRAAQAEAENIAKAGVLFRRNMQNLVFEPIRAARAARKNPASQGLRVP